MNRYAVLGAGLMGLVAAEDLLECEPGAQVTLIDRDISLLHNARQRINSPRLTTNQLNITDTESADKALAGHTAILSALPLKLSLSGIKAAMSAGVSIIDLSGESPEKRIELENKISNAGITVIPGCGVAPGISNVCVGRSVELLDRTENAVIYVGGIPKKKCPPLDYKTVYSLESVFHYYTKPARIFRDGEEVKVEALSGLEPVNFADPPGELEAFYTDGLASLIFTMKGKITGSLAEKTVRYPGHADQINFLKMCGLLEPGTLHFDGGDISPRELLIHQLSPRLQLESDGDILVLRVVIQGVKNNKPQKHTFEVIDYYDPVTRYTAMARTTVFPAAAAARMIANGIITEKGVQFPENVFHSSRYDYFVSELKKHGVTIRHEVH